MISKLSQKLLNYLLKQEVIDESNAEYYRYGLEITISSSLNILLVLLIGIMFGMIFEAVVFLAAFVSVRIFTGGYHADTYFKCNLYFCILFSILLIIYQKTADIISTYNCMLIILFNEVILLTESPIESKNKSLTKSERKKHKIISIILMTFWSFLGILLYLKSYKIGVLILYTTLLVSILIIIAMIFNERGEKNEKE